MVKFHVLRDYHFISMRVADEKNVIPYTFHHGNSYVQLSNPELMDQEVRDEWSLGCTLNGTLYFYKEYGKYLLQTLDFKKYYLSDTWKKLGWEITRLEENLYGWGVVLFEVLDPHDNLPVTKIVLMKDGKTVSFRSSLITEDDVKYYVGSLFPAFVDVEKVYKRLEAVVCRKKVNWIPVLERLVEKADLIREERSVVRKLTEKNKTVLVFPQGKIKVVGDFPHNRITRSILQKALEKFFSGEKMMITVTPGRIRVSPLKDEDVPGIKVLKTKKGNVFLYKGESYSVGNTVYNFEYVVIDGETYYHVPVALLPEWGCDLSEHVDEVGMARNSLVRSKHKKFSYVSISAPTKVPYRDGLYMHYLSTLDDFTSLDPPKYAKKVRDWKVFRDLVAIEETINGYVFVSESGEKLYYDSSTEKYSVEYREVPDEWIQALDTIRDIVRLVLL